MPSTRIRIRRSIKSWTSRLKFSKLFGEAKGGFGPLAAQAAKEAVLSRAGGPLEIALATRYETMEAYASTEDVEEGKAAFGERRAPVWKGR